MVRPFTRPSRAAAGVFVASLWYAVPADAQMCPSAAELTKGLTLPLAAVRFLADDRLEGRRAGSPGERCAGEYIAAEFERIGLRPAGEQGYFQNVPLASALNPHGSAGTGRNVIAVLDGTDDTLKREWIVIGAHYDHLGDGGPGSLVRERVTHNGADDNASGVAVMLRAAEKLSAAPRPARSVLFIAFTGEELGLLGSAHFMTHPTIGPAPAVAMINLDMVGRLGAGPLITYGVDTAEEWKTIIDPAAERTGLTLATRGDGYGPSDHTSFYLKDVPVLHFFTNTHPDYHRPTDDWPQVDEAGMEKVSTLVADIARQVATRRPVALTLRRGAGKPPAASSQMGAGSSYLGTIPDFTPVARGVKISGVTGGSPANAAGLHGGDIIVGLGAHDVADLQGLTDALRAHKPGQTVDVRVLRDGKEVVLNVTLGARK
jgi:Peptidase family M28/PDZ domain